MTNIAREIQFETSSEIVDAITFLDQAYGELLDIFAEYNPAQAVWQKQALTEKVSRNLSNIMQLEEEILYPAIKRAFKDGGLMSLVAMSHSHSLLRYLLREISSLDADSAIYDIKINVLGDHVKHYVKEQKNRFFAKMNASLKIDVWSLGVQLAQRKQQLCYAL